MTAADAPEAVENDQRMAGARGSWMPNAMLRRDKLWLPSSVLKLWCDAWADMVTDVHLRRHAASRRTEAAAIPRMSPAG